MRFLLLSIASPTTGGQILVENAASPAVNLKNIILQGVYVFYLTS